MPCLLPRTFLSVCTGKSFSGALILASVNPQYEKIVHWIPRKIQLHNMLCTKIHSFFILFWHSKQYLYTTCCELVFFGEFNEQSLVILWVNWFKNERFWKIFTYRIVASTNTCYYSENQIFWFLKSWIVTCRNFF